ncbi:MAG: HupE/UreJ family protein [Burkholderiaceae bacterium]|nr:HupE/UreJ family protein [Burkholderiaceae bacterium]
MRAFLLRRGAAASRFAGRALCAAAAVLILCQPASAHLMPAGQGTINIRENSAYALISVPVAALSGFDDDSDGRMSLAELNRHRAALLRQVDDRLALRNAGQAPHTVFEDLLIPHEHPPDPPGPSAYLTSMRHLQWPSAPDALTLRASLFEGPLSGQPLALRATWGERSEPVVLTAGHAQHAFFQGPPASFLRFMLLGAQHILTGWDHLLFLLTVLAVGAGWRYWLAVTASFTVAHSITLTLSALDWISLSPAIVEPLIAASIVLMALDRLWRGEDGARERALLVFACGLIHGLGFASGLRELGGAGEHRWAGLLGFNFGVELGQLVFASLVLLLLGVFQRLRRVAAPAQA